MIENGARTSVQSALRALDDRIYELLGDAPDEFRQVQATVRLMRDSLPALAEQLRDLEEHLQVARAARATADAVLRQCSADCVLLRMAAYRLTQE